MPVFSRSILPTSYNLLIIGGGTNSSTAPEIKSIGTLIWRMILIDAYYKNIEKKTHL